MVQGLFAGVVFGNTRRWSAKDGSFDTCHPLIRLAAVCVAIVMSIIVWYLELTKVGSVPLFIITRLVWNRYSAKDSPLLFVSLLSPHRMVCVAVSRDDEVPVLLLTVLHQVG